jgi:hypothetical protein
VEKERGLTNHTHSKRERRHLLQTKEGKWQIRVEVKWGRGRV